MSVFHCDLCPCLSWMFLHQLQSCITSLRTHGGARIVLMFYQSCHQMKKAELLGHLNREGRESGAVCIIFYSHFLSAQQIFNSNCFQWQKAYSFLWFIVVFLICVSASVICCWNMLKPSKDVDKTRVWIMYYCWGKGEVIMFCILSLFTSHHDSSTVSFCQNSYCFFSKIYIWMRKSL